MFEIFKEFTFEAAHHLAVNVTAGHPYSRLHGHSFRVEVFLRGEPDCAKGWVCDFGEIERLVDAVRGELDHNYLNDIEGLEVPTLENIARWIWQRLHKSLPALDRVLVRRGTCGEGCVFSGTDRSSDTRLDNRPRKPDRRSYAALHAPPRCPRHRAAAAFYRPR